MKRILIILSLVAATLTSQAQPNLDSLYSVWKDNSNPDSLRILAYCDYIIQGILFSNPDTASIMANEVIALSEKGKNLKGLAVGFNIKGVASHFKGDFANALKYYTKCLKAFKQLEDQKGIAQALINIGNIYFVQGNNPKALDNYSQSIKINEQSGNQKEMGTPLMNIGNIYSDQKDDDKALEYYTRSLKIYEKFEDNIGRSNSLSNISNIYADQGKYIEALDYINQSLKIQEQIDNQRGIARSLLAIGLIYMDQGDYSKALEYFKKSLKIEKQMGNQEGIAVTQRYIGLGYLEQGDYIKSMDYCQKALETTTSIGILEEQKLACKCLYDTYKAMGKGNEALSYLEKMNVITDSLNAEETTKKLQQMEFAKQVLSDSLENAEKERFVLQAHQVEVRKKNNTRNILIGGALILLLIAAGFYSRWRYVRKAKNIIEEEKDRSNNLLLNILPHDIAEELKIHGKAEARDFAMVSILFTDFKGFTAAAAKLSAQDLVSEINTCFEVFDGIMDKHKIEKIKTIGDAYMAAGGLPVPTDDSIKNTVLAALEMQDFISQRKIKLDNKGLPAFEMRVGIHTGPVVAGIVGVKKFQYDIWGDTVNTAARMESSGEVGKVNISQATYELLINDSDFTFESRGKIEAKGKGEVEMYFVSKI